MSVLSPLKIKILLHYYVHAGPYRGPENLSSVRDECFNLREQGLLEENPAATDAEDRFNISPRGVVHVQALCDVPLPERVWQTPNR